MTHHTPTHADLVAALQEIDRLATRWHTNGLGNLQMHRKRWQKLGALAHAALTPSQPAAPASAIIVSETHRDNPDQEA